MVNKFQNARLFENRDELTKYCKQFLPESPSIAEVGVFQGANADILLSVIDPRLFFLIDVFNVDDCWSGLFTKNTHLEYIINKYKSVNCIKVLQGLSWDCIHSLDDRSLDYIYIDGDHRYDPFKKDLTQCLKKIKVGGIIQCNDYTNYSIIDKEPYGVFDVVNELIKNNNVEVLGLGIHHKGYHDIAIKIL
jgi:hypothetical protein